jgi:hypothetical protein
MAETFCQQAEENTNPVGMCRVRHDLWEIFLKDSPVGLPILTLLSRKICRHLHIAGFQKHWKSSWHCPQGLKPDANKALRGAA